MKQIFVPIALSILMANPLFAQNPGLKIALLSGTEFAHVYIDSLFGNDLIVTISGTTRRIPVDSIAQIHTRKSSNVVRGISIGLVAGGATGFMAGKIVDGINDQYTTEGNYKLILPLVGGGVGGIIGWIAGSPGSETSIDLTKLTLDEKKNILVPLRRNTDANKGITGTSFPQDEARDVVDLQSDSMAVETAPTSHELDDDQVVPQGQVSLVAGVAIPAGDFASTSGQTAGLAKIGFGFGAQYASFLPNSVFWSISLSASFNPMDESAIRQALGLPSTISAEISSYSTIVPMVGFGFYLSSNPNVLFYGQGQMGMMFARTPDVKFSSGSVTVTQSSASSTTFAYGFQAGLTINRRVSLFARFIAGRPKYKVTASGGGMSVSGEYEQPTSIVQIFAGIVF